MTGVSPDEVHLLARAAIREEDVDWTARFTWNGRRTAGSGPAAEIPAGQIPPSLLTPTPICIGF
ncbi:hypothetical protein [Citricoccus nitrophenolicus]|uniref:hypothetical protein n=1 Tax=Citricoccus nitrophenolicus TaxID=863575 RepID=UPI0031E4F95F